jgi:hypothetical protein
VTSQASILLIVVIVLFLTVWLRRWRNPGRQVNVIENPRVAVASLGEEPSRDIGETDARVYSAFFSNVEMAKLETTGALLDLIGNGRPDILHLYCAMSEDGGLTDGRGGTLPGGGLLEACRRAGVKLLFFASDNPAENYGRAFKGHRRGSGGGVDVVWTIKRSGDRFPFFLGELLRRMSKGESMPMAWVRIAPQAEGEWMEKLPSTIYAPNQ